MSQLTSQLEDHNHKLSLLEQTHALELRELQEKHEEKVCGIQERHEGEVRALQEDKTTFGAKLAVKQEAVYKLEAEIEAKCVRHCWLPYHTHWSSIYLLFLLLCRSKELAVLHQKMEGKDRELASLCSKIAELEDKNSQSHAFFTHTNTKKNTLTYVDFLM